MRLAILGSTGSIGRQALDVVRFHPERFKVVAAVADRNAQLLAEQARDMGIGFLGLHRPPEEFHAPDGLNAEWVFGAEAAVAAATLPEVDAVLCAVVGSAGIRATLAALKAGKRVLLANKETLVAGGELVMRTARASGALMLPVDSEHSAIFQCLQGASQAPKRLILTASGGPFRTWGKERIANATRADALAHPTWRMGPKITVDCASMMNKGLELIEARWLFDVPGERIDIAVHPQSIVHSAVEFEDGSILAQMGSPDMRTPIQLAMTWPDRLPSPAARLDMSALATLTFEPPDEARFPCLALAREALGAGGTAPAILNAANEEAVALFLDGRIRFGRIPEMVHSALGAVEHGPADTLESILGDDARARAYVRSHVFT